MNLSELQKRVFTSLVLLPILFFLIFFNKLTFIILIIITTIVSFFEWSFMNRNKISITLLAGFLVILLSFTSAYFIRGNSIETTIIFVWIISICFTSDIGAFFFGKYLGKKKITKISPNKTYTGAFGGLLCSIIPILIFDLIDISDLNITFKTVFISLALSITCQVGDLIVSFFKRLNNIKHTGNILPGHGGLLDRIDGIIFVLIVSGLFKYINII